MNYSLEKNKPKEYTLEQLHTMNLTDPFKHSIKIPPNSSNCKYILHATGDCNAINGRIYVALPIDTDCNNRYIQEKYNLW
tara:strand:+ start:64 stop:303 length:240 start_codon:yes stop_codon:yes gene_type:complete